MPSDEGGKCSFRLSPPYVPSTRPVLASTAVTMNGITWVPLIWPIPVIPGRALTGMSGPRASAGQDNSRCGSRSGWCEQPHHSLSTLTVRTDHDLPRIWNAISALSLYRAITYKSGGSVRASWSRFLPAACGRYAAPGGTGDQPSPARDLFAHSRGLGTDGRRGPRQGGGAWPIQRHGIRHLDRQRATLAVMFLRPHERIRRDQVSKTAVKFSGPR
jgi:hypothetical protein